MELREIEGKESRRCLLDLMAKSWFSAFWVCSLFKQTLVSILFLAGTLQPCTFMWDWLSASSFLDRVPFKVTSLLWIPPQVLRIFIPLTSGVDFGPITAGNFCQTVTLSGSVCWLPVDWTSIASFRGQGTLWSPLGEGNGTPLQYSCLENPTDGGAW